MPTYEYVCRQCQAHFEAFQRITEGPLTRCELCGTEGTVTRLVGAGTGLIFKGSGFYITDYRKSNSSPSTKSEESKNGNGKASKPESKPESPAPKSGAKED